MAPQEHPGPLHTLREDARAIFLHALDASRIERAFHQHIRCEGATLILDHIPPDPASADQLPAPASRIDLEGYRRIVIVALGKAAVPMTHAMLAALPPRLHVRGICSAPSLPAQPDPRIRYYAGGHPLPNKDSFRAARRALRMLRRTTRKTFVIYLISGGGSTLFELPLDRRLTLADTVAFHRALIASGATIAEVNTLRKHFSAVKGGRLATAAPHARKLTLQVLDVPDRHADAVASGPTLADPSTVADCRELLDRYQLLEKFPPAVQRFFSRPDLPETPGDKAALRRAAEIIEQTKQAGRSSGSFVNFGTQPPVLTDWLFTLLSNRDLLRAASEKAATLGYEIVIDNGCDDWPYEKAAAYLIDRLAALRAAQPGQKICLLSGGEVTVHIDRTPGVGGRNQQFALASALLLNQRFPAEPIVCLSAGSDGADGNSPAAGALAGASTITRAHDRGLDAQATLAAFDAGTLFAALGDALVIGPTGNNLRDLRILLSG